MWEAATILVEFPTKKNKKNMNEHFKHLSYLIYSTAYVHLHILLLYPQDALN